VRSRQRLEAIGSKGDPIKALKALIRFEIVKARSRCERGSQGIAVGWHIELMRRQRDVIANC
jgi:hypothetical protein